MTEHNRVGPLTANMIAKLFQPGAVSQGSEGETRRVAQNDVDGPAEMAAQAIKAGACWVTEEDKNRLLTLSPMNAEFMGYGKGDLVDLELPDPRGIGPTPWKKGLEGTQGRDAHEKLPSLEGTPEERSILGLFGAPDPAPTLPPTPEETRARLLGKKPVKPLDVDRLWRTKPELKSLEQTIRDHERDA